MFGEKACALIRELDRSKDNLAPYNNELLAEISKEVKELFESNRNDAAANEDSIGSSGASYIATVRIRHAAIQRNIRCILAYHYSRVRCLRTMRWEFGSILPAEIKANLSASESEWFTKYSNSLATYMRSLGDGCGINLAVDLRPPKALYIEVRCVVDYGKYELNNGTVLLLKKNSRHFLPRSECEELIRQGIFEHIVS